MYTRIQCIFFFLRKFLENLFHKPVLIKRNEKSPFEFEARLTFSQGIAVDS